MSFDFTKVNLPKFETDKLNVECSEDGSCKIWKKGATSIPYGVCINYEDMKEVTKFLSETYLEGDDSSKYDGGFHPLGEFEKNYENRGGWLSWILIIMVVIIISCLAFIKH
jgi:hypothetical protein